jgi:hypothetical protein
MLGMAGQRRICPGALLIFNSNSVAKGRPVTVGGLKSAQDEGP